MPAFSLVGSYQVEPSADFPSGSSAITTRLTEAVVLDLFSRKDYILTADPAVTVEFDSMTRAEVVIVRCSSKVTVTVTSADGSAQVFPADPLALIISKTVPYTAVTLTRVAGTETTCQVFIGQKTP